MASLGPRTEQATLTSLPERNRPGDGKQVEDSRQQIHAGRLVVGDLLAFSLLTRIEFLQRLLRNLRRAVHRSEGGCFDSRVPPISFVVSMGILYRLPMSSHQCVHGQQLRM